MSTLARTFVRGPVATLAVLLAPAAPDWADLDAAALRLWDGNWSVACDNTAAPNLRVMQSSLMVVARNRQLTGRQVRPAYSYFGQSTPENFDVALLSEVRPGAEFTFLIWRDARGPCIEISADKAVEASLAPILGSTLRAKYRDCNAAARPPSGGALHGRVLRHGRRVALVGYPPPEVTTALETLWRQKWRLGQQG